MAWVAFPESWQTAMLRNCEEVSKNHSKKIKAQPLTMGQLIQQHGEVEATQLIAEKEVIPVQKPGSSIVRYIRVDESEEIGMSHMRKLELERTVWVI